MSDNYWWEKYIGIPFKANGRTAEGLDCGGLVLLTMNQECGKHPLDVNECFCDKDLNSRIGMGKMKHILSKCLARWHEVPLSEMKEHDTVLYDVHGVECHCAVAIDSRRVMHVEYKHPVHVVPVHIPGYQISRVMRYEYPE